MLRIVAIGGGEIGRPGHDVETTELDAAVVDLVDRPRPRVLFIGTASRDDPSYFDVFHAHYGKRLGCTVASLELYGRGTEPTEIRRQIDRSDIVYVGGGNTLRMMMLWRRRGIDHMLIEAATNGTIMAGLSAGAICWVQRGVSDSRSSTATNEDCVYIAVRGLGLVDVLLCPHYDSRGARGNQLPAMVARTGLVGLGLPDCTALHVHGDEWRVLACRDGVVPQLVQPAGKVTDLPATDSFAPLGTLTAPRSSHV